MLFDLQKKMVKLPNLRGGWVSNPYGANQPILSPQLAFSSLLPALQDQVQNEDNDDGQYNHLEIVAVNDENGDNFGEKHNIHWNGDNWWWWKLPQLRRSPECIQPEASLYIWKPPIAMEKSIKDLP